MSKTLIGLGRSCNQAFDCASGICVNNVCR